MCTGMSSAVVLAEKPAKSSMTVGAVVIRPCMISENGVEEMCGSAFRKTVPNMTAKTVDGNLDFYGKTDSRNTPFVEIEF